MTKHTNGASLDRYADTHSTRGFITEVNHMYKIEELTTRLWIPINTNDKVECKNRNPNVSLTRRKKSCNMRRCSHKGLVH